MLNSTSLACFRSQLRTKWVWTQRSVVGHCQGLCVGTLQWGLRAHPAPVPLGSDTLQCYKVLGGPTLEGAKDCPPGGGLHSGRRLSSPSAPPPPTPWGHKGRCHEVVPTFSDCKLCFWAKSGLWPAFHRPRGKNPDFDTPRLWDPGMAI